ncbi:MAG: PadR family transcriptional regulator [Candidatus Omnitrophica bacterium]|nr:PadR family transcriptional regulator [Candidatus Omnitrophota bacterium]
MKKEEKIKYELLFLGLLRIGPKHPYQIKKMLREELAPFFTLDIKSIYYPLEKLKQGGLVKRKTGKISRRPQRYIYELTEKGKVRFNQILKENFLKVERPYFNVDLSLYFLEYLKPKIAKRLFLARTGFLKRIEKGLNKLKKESKSSIIIEHDLDLVKAEAESLSRLYSRIQNF